MSTSVLQQHSQAVTMGISHVLTLTGCNYEQQSIIRAAWDHQSNMNTSRHASVSHIESSNSQRHFHTTKLDTSHHAVSGYQQSFKAIRPGRKALPPITGCTAQQSGLYSLARPTKKVSVPPPPLTGHTVQQYNQICSPRYVNDLLSPSSLDPVGVGSSRYTARRHNEDPNFYRSKDNDKTYPYQPIGAKRTCRYEHNLCCFCKAEHDLCCYCGGDHRRRNCGIAPGDIRRGTPSTSVLTPSIASLSTLSPAFHASSKKVVPSHAIAAFHGPMPLRLNNTSLPPKKVPKLGGKPENTVLKIRETLAPYLQVLDLHEDIDVASFDGGDWNAIYIITSSTFEPVLFRMSLDVTVEDKLESEVATMEFVRRHTSIPVPRVYAYDPSCNNAVGSAFILLEYIKSVRYYDIQDDLTDEQQRDVGRQVAEWCHQLHKLSFDKIGSLYFHDGDFALGPLVCDNNPNGWRDDPATFHGPFSSEEEYYRSLWEYELRRCQDEGNNNPRFLQRIESVKELLACLPRLAAGRDLIGDPARLRHVDITENNILVDTTGRAVALIDWERANAMPSKATVPYIIEESGNPKPYHVPLKAGYYERMEELHTGYLQSVFSKQASEDSKLHLFLQESDGYIDSSIIKRHVEACGTSSLPKLSLGRMYLETTPPDEREGDRRT